jgi:anti-sigma B factor antagonist
MAAASSQCDHCIANIISILKEETMALIRDELMGEIRVIVIENERLLDATEVEQCYREIVEVLNKTRENRVLLNFGKVKYLSSTALGMFIRVLKKCKEYKLTLKLCNLTPDNYQVFTLTGMNKILDIYEDCTQAMDAFKKK